MGDWEGNHVTKTSLFAWAAERWAGAQCAGGEVPLEANSEGLSLAEGLVVGERQTQWGRVSGSQGSLSCRESNFLLQEAASFIHSFIHSLTHSLVQQT